ncbi:MAG: hypothetical protein ACYCW6_20435 [Candidatus Xenobia bacterium]
MTSSSLNVPTLHALADAVEHLENALFPPAATRTSPALRGALHSFRIDLGLLGQRWAQAPRMHAAVDLLIDACLLLAHALGTRTHAGVLAVRSDREQIAARYHRVTTLEQPASELMEATRLAILTCLEACDAVLEERFNPAAQSA